MSIIDRTLRTRACRTIYPHNIQSTFSEDRDERKKCFVLGENRTKTSDDPSSFRPRDFLPLFDRAVRFGLEQRCLLLLSRFSFRANPAHRSENPGFSLLGAYNRSACFTVIFVDLNVAPMHGVGYLMPTAPFLR
jgi:hypothetical protein